MIAVDTRRTSIELGEELAGLTAERDLLRQELDAFGVKRNELMESARTSARRGHPGIIDPDKVPHHLVEEVDIRNSQVNRRLQQVDRQRGDLAVELRAARRVEDAEAAAVDIDAVAATAATANTKVATLQTQIAQLPSRRQAAVMDASPQRLVDVEKDSVVLPARLAAARTEQLRAQLTLEEVRMAHAIVELDDRAREVERLDAIARHAADDVQRARGPVQAAQQRLALANARVGAAQRALEAHVG